MKYNYLSLPKSVQYRRGDRIEYVYDAAGVKRQTTHKITITDLNYPYWSLSEPASTDFDASKTVTTDYIGNKVYVNNQLKYVLTEEGYIEKTTGSSTYTPYYYLNDRLGSRRIVMDAAGTVKFYNNYYPSGTSMAELPRETSYNTHPYKFTGKELDRFNTLDFYDFDARAYYPALMRFMSVDPLAGKYPGVSPYAYCLNNPVKYVDPDGRDVWDFILGFVHSVTSNLSVGAIRQSTNGIVSNANHYNAGRTTGDVVSVGMGISEMVAGGGTAAGGAVATVGTVGTASPVSVPTAAAGVGVAIHGAAVTGKATASLMTKDGRISQAEATRGNEQNNSSSGSSDKGTLSDTKNAVQKAQNEVGGSLPKGEPGKFGSPQRGDSNKGYRLDPPHPNKAPNNPESKPHVNWWDWTQGKKGSGGRWGTFPIE